MGILILLFDILSGKIVGKKSFLFVSNFCLNFQFEKYPNLNYTLTGFCIVVSTFVEGLRIYTGYSGNINSDVSLIQHALGSIS